ncbi:unnamed protein product [Rotaria magnacalcarata]|uniref:Uncharacterized protein n=1 Tax=Rotaria magnacalcarata TaxID=392030 RepID=A0A815AC08_9BILA|nr:unnamed protein product [Rotaria magnacalcarata]CAF4398559.1 unnamed protein product [Rotaria magnacalcarata]
MSEQKFKSTVPKPSGDVVRPRRRVAQNYLVIWVDSNIDPKTDDCKSTLEKLRAVVHDVQLCTTSEQCVEFLNEIDDQKAFIISSGALGQHLVGNVHEMSQVEAIYIFCGNKARHKQWANEWPKIRGVFTSIKPICESLKEVAREYDQDMIPMSSVAKEKTTWSEENLNQLEPTYMYSVLFKEILLEIDGDDTKSINTFVTYCRMQNIPEAQLNEFQKNYHQKTPVWWYTSEMFLNDMLDRALRTLDMEAMTKLRFFIRDLHLQLEQLHKEQPNEFDKQFIVYRGEIFTKQDFQHLIDANGGLLSFNIFLDTSKDQKMAMKFAEWAMKKNEDAIGVIFIMTIDQYKMSTKTIPFAMIDDYSAFPSEHTILFTMHTVFRVCGIKQTANNSRLWEVKLTITEDNDPQLATLTNCIKNEIEGATGWHRLGHLMIKVGHFNQAEEFCNELLKNASDDSDRANIYHMLGMLKYHQGKYQEAVAFYEKSLKIKRKTLPDDDISLASTYSNIGQVYNNMADYSKALVFYEKSLKIREISLPPNHPDLATSYNNIGQAYHNMGNHSKALEFFEKFLKIREISLPPNHPDLGQSYNNIGQVYNKMNEYSKALSYIDKALAIWQKSLPPTHPNIKGAMNSIEHVKKKL